MRNYTPILILMLLTMFVQKVEAQKSSKLNYIDENDKWSYHFQTTTVAQYHNGFHSPYSGQNSLKDSTETAITLTSTFFVGRKLWEGASMFLNPEMSGGSGISGGRGIAAFTNGEAFRVGNPAPVVYIGRFFLRQHFHFNGDTEQKEEGLNQCAENLKPHRLVLTLGKLCLADIFDNNSVSHDPRMDFLNWGLMNNGAWDYAANTRGYTTSFITEYYRFNWVVRGGISLVANTVNGPNMEWDISKGQGLTFEAEHKHTIKKRDGSIRLLGYRNKSLASSYQGVINQFQSTGNVEDLNVYASDQYKGVKYGFGLNMDQEISNDIGFFSRIGWNNGKTATWAFAEIDQTASAGIKIAGTKWKRPQDNFGIAGVVNGISKTHQEYMRLGGYGFMIGDGKLLRYDNEEIIEVFYSARIANSLFLTGDYQFVKNPAYNKDRGPIHIFALRVHFEFK
jgi:high affinity Mn2+ porin